MKFKVSRDTLLKPLQQVTGVVERRQTLPVLSNVMMVVDESNLSMTGTDLEVEMIARLPLEGAEPGEITVPAKKLMDIVKELPDKADVEFTLKDQRLSVSSGRFKSTLSTLPVNDFPSVETAQASATTLEVNSKSFKQLLDKTAFAMAQQDVRYFLNGMLIEISQGMIRSVATDGHRLATSKLDIEHNCEDQQVIVPRKGVIELQRLLNEIEGDVRLTLTENHLCAESSAFVMTTKLVDGRFPDYDRVIPKNGDKNVIADRMELRQALNRTAILSNEKFRGIRVNLASGNLMLSANNPEQEEAEETVNVDYEGESIEVGFNVHYLQDVLNVLEADQVKLVLHDANSSALVGEPEDEDSIYVVMPMKL